MIDDDELLAIFVEESQDILVALNDQVKKWQSDPLQEDTVEPILREMHTLKGNSRMIGLKLFSDYLHSLEQIWQMIQPGKMAVDSDVVKTVVELMTFVEEYLHDFFRTKQEPSKNIPIEYANRLIEEFQDPLNVSAESKDTMLSSNVNAQDEHANITHTLSDTIRVKIDDLDKLAQIGSEINLDRVHGEQESKIMTTLIMEIRKELISLQDQVKQLQLKADANIKSQVTTLHGNQDFDILEMDYYSSLQQLTRVLNDKVTLVQNLNHAGLEAVKRNTHVLRNLGRSTRSLEEEIRHTRLISLDYFIPRLEHMVATLATELGKSVQLRCARFEGEIDRKIIDKLIAPLEHLIRNSIDHGIELPELRKQIGKSENGLLTLSMMKKGNDIHIELTDDGKGIDIESIKAKALEEKLWDGKVQLTDQEWYQLIYLSGFSTKAEATAISGHGVGLDVVNTEIHKLGGNIILQSQEGKGTTFTLKIPVSLSLSQALIFYIGDQQYAILLSQLEGITRLPYQKIESRINKIDEKIEIRNNKYALFQLDKILNNQMNVAAQRKHHMVPIVLLRSSRQALGLVVDKLIGCSEVVVKPMVTPVEILKEISGVSITSSGDIVLVLDAAQIMQRALNLNVDVDLMSSKWDKAKSSIRSEVKKILVVDDSNTVREIMSRFLQRNNYLPLLAKDGVEALKVMYSESPDLILLDLEMPTMNGFEVLETISQDPHLTLIPVIVITSRSSKKHQNKAEELGANAYVTKPYREPELLALIQKWMPQ